MTIREGYSQMMGSPYKTRECHIREPLYRHSSKPTAKIVVGKSTAPRGSYMRGGHMSKRRNERVSNGWRRRQLRARVLAAYDVCAICAQPVDKTLKTPHPMSAEVDELIPVSRGGDPYSFANCRLTHRRCNRMKSDKTDEHARALLAGRQEVKSSSMPFKTFGI